MTFICFSVANVNYELFGKLQKGSSPGFMTENNIVIYCVKYSELFKSPKNQLMLENDEIVRNAGNIGNTRKAEDVEDPGDKNTGEVKDVGDVIDKEAGSGNERGD